MTLKQQIEASMLRVELALTMLRLERRELERLLQQLRERETDDAEKNESREAYDRTDRAAGEHRAV